jgi:hypothetical protein
MANGSNSGPLGIPPGGPWFVYPLSGTIQQQNNKILAQGLATAGWVGFPTQALAKTAAETMVGPKDAAAAVGGIKGAVTDTGDFLSRLTSAALWLRIAEVALGLILIAVGVAKLTNALPAATKVAKGAAKVGEVAALA